MNCEPCINEFIPQTKRLTKDEILEAICMKYGIEIRQMKGKRRDYNIVEARHLLCYVLNSDNYLRMYLREIGELLNRHHSTIIHSIQTIENMIKINDKSFMVKLNSVKHLIHEKNSQYFN
jgi:chromosomal replication initiator protein